MTLVGKTILFVTLSLSRTEAFMSPSHSTTDVRSSMLKMSGNDETSSRRVMLGKTTASFVSVASILSGNPIAAVAKAPPTPDELARIKTGYERMTYLLDNFDQETTVCRENGGECKRDADPVRRYMGLRSTTDPLFQIEKVFDKVKYMDIDPDKLEPFFEATEEWNTAVNMSNSMAFISQFGVS